MIQIKMIVSLGIIMGSVAINYSGYAQNNNQIYDNYSRAISGINFQGNVYDSNHSIMTRIDSDGRVYNRSNQVTGQVDPQHKYMGFLLLQKKD